MNLEIEAKISVPSLEFISERLVRIGAEFLKTVQETDTYLMDPEKRLLAAGCGLRLRRQIGPSGETVYLTFKGPRLKSRFKSRTESETRISDHDTTLKIFAELGYTPAILVEKNRQIWKWESCLICLDDVSKLGCFVEVEGPDENEIENALLQLGLSDQRHISQGYASLMADTFGFGQTSM